MVPVAGLEPAPCCQDWILSPGRLPFHHTGIFCFPSLLFFPSPENGENNRNYAKPKNLINGLSTGFLAVLHGFER